MNLEKALFSSNISGTAAPERQNGESVALSCYSQFFPKSGCPPARPQSTEKNHLYTRFF